MINLYVWKPLDLAVALEKGLMPDLGHAAIEVVDSDHSPLTYVSFWPEMETLVGAAIQPFKNRIARHPTSYDQESDHAEGYMQRHADFIEHIDGLTEERIVAGWPTLRDSTYDLSTWNCSNVCKFLLLHSMSKEESERIAAQVAASLDDLLHIHGDTEFWEKISFLATSPFINCRPEDLLLLAQVYSEKGETAPGDEAAPTDADSAATGIAAGILGDLLPELAAKAAGESAT